MTLGHIFVITKALGHRAQPTNPAPLSSCIALTIRTLPGLVFLLTLFSCNWANAATPTADFEAANKLYEEGKFRDAIAAYEKLTSSGEASASIYFNLGNALYKSGQMGRAVAAYRQAQRLSPRDPDIRANLQFARNQAQGPTLSPTPFGRWLTRLTLNEWTTMASVALWIVLLGLAAIQWRPAWQKSVRIYLWFFGGLAVLLWLCVGAAWQESVSKHTAIIVTRDAVVRHGPLDESSTAFVVHDGAELRVLDRKDDWLQVSIDGRRVGWLHQNQVVLDPKS